MAEEYKVGDVLLIKGGAYAGMFLDNVTRITPTGKVRTSKGYLFSVEGRQIGGNQWHQLSMKKATPADEQRIRDSKRKEVICSWIRATHLRSLPLAALERIYTLMGGE